MNVEILQASPPRDDLVEEIAISLSEQEVIIEAIGRGEPDAAQLAVEVNWRNAAERLQRVIDSVGERGSW